MAKTTGCPRCGGRGFVYDPYNRTAYRCAECQMREDLDRQGGETRTTVREEQPPFQGFPPFEKQSDTSRAAAATIEPRADTLRGQVLAIIRASGFKGMTDAEVERALGLRHQTASARRRELHLQGLVGTEGVRKNPSGAMAQVWKAAAYCQDPEATVAQREQRRCRHCGRMT